MKIIIFIILLFSLSCEKKKDVQSIPQPTPKVEQKTEVIKEPVIVEEKKNTDAIFLKMNGDVLHKRSGNLVWDDSQLETDLFLKDWVKTGSDSRCTISMKNNRLLKLSANSRVILLEKSDTAQKHRAVVAISGGEVEGEIQGQENVDSELVLKLPHAWLRVKSSVKEGVKKIFRISLTNNEMKIHAKQGEVEVLTKGKVVKLTNNKMYKRKVSKNTDEEELSFISAVEPPQEIEPENNVKPEPQKAPLPKVVKRKTKFLIKSPENGLVTSQDRVTVNGTVEEGQELFFRGQKINLKNRAFSFSVDLELGINVLTVQAIKGADVKYKTLEIERK